MPRIPRSEQAVGVSATQQPFSTGDGYAAPGRALSEVGKQLSTLALHLEKQDEDLSTFEMQSAYQEWRNKENQRRLQADTELTGDGRGHVEREDQTTDQSFAELRQRFVDRPNIARRLELQYGNDRNRWGSRSFGAQQGRIGPHYTERAGSHFETAIRPNLFMRDPQTGVPFESGLDSVRRGSAMVDQWLDGAAGLPADVREGIRGRLVNELYRQWLQNAGPEAAVEREEVIRQLQLGRAGVTSLDALEQPADVMLDVDRPPAERRPRRGDPRPAGDLEFLPVPGGATPRGARPRSGAVEGIVIHHTAGTTLESAISQNRLAGTGYNYYVDQEGRVYRFAPDEQRMVHIRNPGDQHRSRGAWDNLNLDNTISVSAVAPDDGAVTPAQRQAMERLVGQLARQHGVDPRNIVGHGDIQGGPGGNREASEGTTTARAFREGRIPLEGSAPVRLAQGGPVTTEQRVWERIVGEAVNIEEHARTARHRLERDERAEVVRDRQSTAALGDRLAINLQARRQRDLQTPGVTSTGDPADANVTSDWLAANPDRPLELSREWLEANADRLYSSDRNRLMRLLMGPRQTPRYSDMGLHSHLSRMVNDPTTPPEVAYRLIEDAWTTGFLNRGDYDMLSGRARGFMNAPGAVRAPEWVTDSYREMNRAIGIPPRQGTEQDRARYNAAWSDLNRFVADQERSGTLEPKALGEKVKEISARFRQSSVDDRIRVLAAEPRSRFLRTPADRATLDDVASATAAARQQLDVLAQDAVVLGTGGFPTPALLELAREAHHLRRLHEALVDRYKAENNGKDPPAPKPAATGTSAAPAPATPAATPADQLQQRFGGPPEGFVGQPEQPTQPRRRTRRLQYDDDGNIIGVEETAE